MKKKINKPETNLKPNVDTSNKSVNMGSSSNDKKNKKETNNNNNNNNNNNSKTVLNKMDINGDKRELSEGEALSEFEIFSSISSKNDLDNLDLDLNSEKEDFNVSVKIENDLCQKDLREKLKRRQYSHYCDYDSDSLLRSSSRDGSDCYSNESPSMRHDRCKLDWSRKRRRGEKRRHEEGKSRFYRKSRWLSSREGDDDCYKSRKWHDKELKGSRDFSYSRSKRSRSSERILISRSPIHRDSRRRRKTRKDDRDFDSYQYSRKSYSKRKSYLGNENKCTSVSPRRKRSRWDYNANDSLASQEWKRTQRQTRLSDDDRNDKTFKPLTSQNIKQARARFVEDLEKKIKEAELVKKLMEVKKMQRNVASIPEPPAPQPISYPTAQFPIPVQPSELVHPLFHAPAPSSSADKLPSMPGSIESAIRRAGDPIPHDLDGRRIPVGPNGHYLPLDPGGRLFPHIVSPGNTAVPIHMTDDGVLRLPNSEPVPFGPPHRLPVNIDGSIILMGPDSKPLHPYPNIPNHSPLQSSPKSLYGVPGVGLSPAGDAPAHQPPPQKEITESLTKCQEKTNQRTEGVGGFADFRKNPSKEGIKTSSPVKVEEKNEEFGDTCSDMVLDSSDSDSSFVSKPTGETGGSCEKTSGSDEEDVLQIVCDVLRNSEVPQAETADPLVRRIRLAIRSLNEKNYRPPPFGRFVLLNTAGSLRVQFPNESPLLRNRVKLPFTTTSLSKNVARRKEEDTPEKPVCFRRDGPNAEINPAKVFRSVRTFDFAVQCDLTSEVTKGLDEKVFQATREIIRLKKANADLLEDYTQIEADNEKKNVELRKVYDELAGKNNEITSLKRAIEEGNN